MIMFKLLAVTSTFLLASVGWAEKPNSAVTTDEICEIRPDLCGEKPKKKKVVKKKCRKKGASFALDDADLPICGESTEPVTEAASSSEEAPALADGEKETGKRARSKQAARKKISFSSYLNANSNHPAISFSPAKRQDAFLPPPTRMPASSSTTSSDASSPAAPTSTSENSQSVRESPPSQ